MGAVGRFLDMSRRPPGKPVRGIIPIDPPPCTKFPGQRLTSLEQQIDAWDPEWNRNSIPPSDDEYCELYADISSGIAREQQLLAYHQRNTGQSDATRKDIVRANATLSHAQRLRKRLERLRTITLIALFQAAGYGPPPPQPPQPQPPQPKPKPEPVMPAAGSIPVAVAAAPTATKNLFPTSLVAASTDYASTVLTVMAGISTLPNELIGVINEYLEWKWR